MASELEQFEAEVRAVEPAARLVPERHLRKLLHFLRDHGRTIPRNPRLPLWVSREDLAAADVTPRTVFSGTEDPLLILTTPDDRSIDGLPKAEQLREYWMLLYEAALLARLGKLHESSCGSRLAKLGPAAVREVQFVLEAEHLADPEADDVGFYRTFAATYLVLDAFAPECTADFYPSLPPRKDVLELIGHDFDLEAMLMRSRPAGAAERVHLEPPKHAERSIVPADSPARATFIAQAREADSKGNFVRAAILLEKIGDSQSRESLGRLVQALGEILEWNAETQSKWREGLASLLKPAATGDWPRAARCLYELQKIPGDLRNEVFAVDLVEPIRTFGRRPVKRPLPHARGVMILLQLRAARTQLHKSGLDPHLQHEVDELFEAEIHHRDALVRERLTPIITKALTESGFVPANAVETVAREKVVAELLDRVSERGQLRFGHLRDAIARNQLKMPDLRGPGEFFSGDPLLKADTRLAYDLDGVYRRGEFYLRALQRGSSLFFGTPWGRWLFLYLIAPFLAAFLTLTFAIEVEHIGGKIKRFASKILAPRQVLRPSTAPQTGPVAGTTIVLAWDEDGHMVWHERDQYEWDDDGHLVWIEPEPELVWDEDDNLVFVDRDELESLAKSLLTASRPPPAPDGAKGEAHESAFPAWEPVFVLGVFLLLMFHVPSFRRAFFNVVRGLFTTLVSIVWTIPKRVLQSRIVTAVRYSPPMRFIGRYLVAPILIAAVVVLFLTFLGASQNRLLRWGGIVLGAAFLALNTPWGWSVQERIAESVSDGWRVFRVNFLPGLVATVLDWFRRLANWVERQLYEVDEWLRFRGGDSGGSLATKAIVGLFWFPFAYVARFSFYLLIEPQVNPVKHFPVVTVSHKVILPMTGSLANALDVATGTAFWILAGVPGIFGFIAWELLSNWKLYAANRPAALKPATIGSHGETMRGLLRPGFHSGTVPKLYRKLRRADVRHDRHAASHLHHELHHAAEGVERFVERELLPLCREQYELSFVRFGCQRVEIGVSRHGSTQALLVLSFENRDGRIAGSAAWPTKEQPGEMVRAVEGLFDLAATEVQDDADRTPMAWNDWVAQWSTGVPRPPAA